MVSGIGNGRVKPRSRHQALSRATRIREVLRELPEESLNQVKEVRAAIKAMKPKVVLSDSAIYSHMKQVRIERGIPQIKVLKNGTVKTNGVGSGTPGGGVSVASFQAVKRAVNTCGSIEVLRQTLDMIELAKGL